jgi:hypothetical protein
MNLIYGTIVTLGQEYPRQGDMPELAHIGEIVVSGQALLADPIHCFRQPPLCNPHARFLRRDGMNIRNNARNMQSLGFVEQI